MRIDEVITERRQQKTEIMYHGTSTNLVRSIMKNGLLANPPKKTYDVDTYGASTASMGGVYVANNKEFAALIADEAVGTHGGEKALVTLQYVKGSADLDEDDIVGAISDGAKRVMVNISNKAPNSRASWLPKDFGTDQEKADDPYSELSYPAQGWAVDQMIKNIDKASTLIAKETVKILSKKAQPRKAAAVLIKQMAVKLLQGASKHENARDRWNAVGFDAFDTFRETMEDLLGKLMRQISPDIADPRAESGSGARRIDRDVKFKGKTRILQIESPIGNIVYKDKTVTESNVQESMNNPYPYTWELEQEDYQVAVAPLSNNTRLDVTFDNTDNSWFIDFSVDFSQDKTGAGDEFRIFATVVAVIKDWWKNKFDKKADAIVWSGSKREEEGNSRVKLYKRFAQQMASQTGWKLSITDGGTADLFKLSNPNPKARVSNED